MDLVAGILNVLTPYYLFYCFLGCLLGTLIGVLPGLGPASTMSILLPLTMYMDPTASIVMLAGLYYGAQYGGSTASILLNIPGEISSVVTCIDGYEMTRKGLAGRALWIAAVGSFIAGLLAAIAISFIGPGLAKYALKFGPPEYAALILFSFAMLISLSGGSITKGLAAGLIGMVLASVGSDPLTGISRFDYGATSLMRGFENIPLVVGLFGIAEILLNAEAGVSRIYAGKIGKMMPRGKELVAGLWASVRGAVIGFVPGILPGMVGALTTFWAYDFEKRISQHPEKFGTGVIEGVAAPEAANNATCQAGIIPLLSLGIPTTPSWAIVLAALMVQGLQPGPMLFQGDTRFVWTVIGSLLVGNVMLLVLNLPLVGLWARVSLIPFRYLGPGILAVCVVGAYSPRNTLFDVWVALGGGVLGYVMRKTGWPITPLILGVILGPMFETALRQSMSMGGAAVFLDRPIAVTFGLLTMLMVFLSLKFHKRGLVESSDI